MSSAALPLLCTDTEAAASGIHGARLPVRRDKESAGRQRPHLLQMPLQGGLRTHPWDPGLFRESPWGAR